MHANFSIQTNPSRLRVDIVFQGFWSIATVDAYCAERTKVVAQLRAMGCPFSTCSVLVDATSLTAQPLDSVAEFARQVGGSKEQPRRSALLVASALFQLQGIRMAIPNQQVFTDRSEAMRWLDETVSETGDGAGSAPDLEVPNQNARSSSVIL